MAFAIVLGIGFLLIVSLTVNAALSAVGERFNTALPIPAWAFKALDFAITYIVIAVLFAVIYTSGSEFAYRMARRDSRRDTHICALRSRQIFNRIYLGTAGIASTYGPRDHWLSCWYGSTIRPRFFSWAQSSRGRMRSCMVRIHATAGAGSPDRCEHRQAREATEEPSLIIQP